jgi:hypothetical protein
VLNTTGALGFNTSDLVGFDISGLSGVSFASLDGARWQQLAALLDQPRHRRRDADRTIGGGLPLVDISVAAVPVPEPETWALLVAGVLVVSAATRRKRTGSAASLG